MMNKTEQEFERELTELAEECVQLVVKMHGRKIIVVGCAFNEQTLLTVIEISMVDKLLAVIENAVGNKEDPEEECLSFLPTLAEVVPRRRIEPKARKTRRPSLHRHLAAGSRSPRGRTRAGARSDRRTKSVRQKQSGLPEIAPTSQDISERSRHALTRNDWDRGRLQLARFGGPMKRCVPYRRSARRRSRV
jgi:hypothetical protein